MNITFRPARKSDREVFNWRLFGVNQSRPTVVTVNGRVALIMEGQNVVYQNGTDGIGELIRARGRVSAAIIKGIVDHDAIARENDAAFKRTMDFLRGKS